MSRQQDDQLLARGWPKSSLGSYSGGKAPAEPPMGRGGTSYYLDGEDPRQSKEPRKDRKFRLVS